MIVPCALIEPLHWPRFIGHNENGLEPPSRVQPVISAAECELVSAYSKRTKSHKAAPLSIPVQGRESA
jgi:hypothetical protein